MFQQMLTNALSSDLPSEGIFIGRQTEYQKLGCHRPALVTNSLLPSLVDRLFLSRSFKVLREMLTSFTKSHYPIL
jgi:hypothetical protein